jgi:hypothetical protein
MAANTERFDQPQSGQRTAEVANKRRLGDLNLQTAGRQASFQQYLVQFLHKVSIIELHGRDVNSDG